MALDPSRNAPISPLEQLKQFLEKNYWDVFANLHQEHGNCDPDVRCQLLLIHDTRLYSVRLKTIHEVHGSDPDIVASQALADVKEHYATELEEEARVNYCSSLTDHLNQLYTSDVVVKIEDRKEGASMPGRRYKVTIKLEKDSGEHRRCGDWVFAESYGRSDQQAAKFAREMLLLKERKGLLWINEKVNDTRAAGKEVSFFNEKELKSLRKFMIEKKIKVPNCLNSGESVMPEIKRHESTLSMKTLWKHSPFGSHGASGTTTTTKPGSTVKGKEVDTKPGSTVKGKEVDTSQTTRSNNRRRAPSPYPRNVESSSHHHHRKLEKKQ